MRKLRVSMMLCVCLVKLNTESDKIPVACVHGDQQKTDTMTDNVVRRKLIHMELEDTHLM